MLLFIVIFLVHATIRYSALITLQLYEEDLEALRKSNLMEKPVKNLSIFPDEDILPGQTLTKTCTIDYNDADENDRRMRSKDFFGIRIMWNPEKIIFENGKLAE